MSRRILLPLHYLPGIEYMSLLLTADEVLIEKHEHYVKQTPRNRCAILSANGPMHLVIPIQHGKGAKIPVHSILAGDHPWQRQHWESMCSAYGKSAFFFYYRDYFAPFYTEKVDHVFEFNLALLKLLLTLLKREVHLGFTTEWKKSYDEDLIDLRSSLTTGTGDQVKEYQQVFREKFPFVPGLSVIDLLFNLGPMSIDYLEHDSGI